MGGWVGAGIIVALWANAIYTQIGVCRSIGCLYNNHTSPGISNINWRFQCLFYFRPGKCRLRLPRSLPGCLSLVVVSSTVVCGLFSTKSLPQIQRLRAPKTCATLMNWRNCNINKITQVFMQTISLMLRLRAGPPRGSAKGVCRALVYMAPL